MTQIGRDISVKPSDRSARRRLHDQLHASLSSAGVSPDVLAIAGDSSRIVELQRHLREELEAQWSDVVSLRPRLQAELKLRLPL
ncbi:Hypothetical protein, putative [Bodo saltans]|uniref:Uncharacterized protein n=1 Tax=Bodo saltans TaxID=75058 RepID=A0A0S4KLW1_BODSA|nr:Hypothetical protein, putative [Bodo saltans]|eukprot:CUI15482.1 Hypothetical protein, putative [Bodo saltans]